MLADRVLAMEDGRVVADCPPSDLPERLGLRSWLHLVMEESRIASALDLLHEHGFEARRNSSGVLVETSSQQKGRAVEILQVAGLHIEDLEVWR